MLDLNKDFCFGPNPSLRENKTLEPVFCAGVILLFLLTKLVPFGVLLLFFQSCIYSCLSFVVSNDFMMFLGFGSDFEGGLTGTPEGPASQGHDQNNFVHLPSHLQDYFHSSRV